MIKETATETREENIKALYKLVTHYGGVDEQTARKIAELIYDTGWRDENDLMPIFQEWAKASSDALHTIRVKLLRLGLED